MPSTLSTHISPWGLQAQKECGGQPCQASTVFAGMGGGGLDKNGVSRGTPPPPPREKGGSHASTVLTGMGGPWGRTGGPHLSTITGETGPGVQHGTSVAPEDHR